MHSILKNKLWETHAQLLGEQSVFSRDVSGPCKSTPERPKAQGSSLLPHVELPSRRHSSMSVHWPCAVWLCSRRATATQPQPSLEHGAATTSHNLSWCIMKRNAGSVKQGRAHERGAQGVNCIQAWHQKRGPGAKGEGLKISWNLTFTYLTRAHLGVGFEGDTQYLGPGSKRGARSQNFLGVSENICIFWEKTYIHILCKPM